VEGSEGKIEISTIMPVAAASSEEENHVASAIKPAWPNCSCTAWDPLPLPPSGVGVGKHIVVEISSNFHKFTVKAHGNLCSSSSVSYDEH
jgi:hypothetical protein